MILPIDTQKVRFIVSRLPKLVMDWDSSQAALSLEGLCYFHVELVAMADGCGAEVIKVRVAGEPQELRPRMLVKVTGLRVTPWVNKERRSSGCRVPRGPYRARCDGTWLRCGDEPDRQSARRESNPRSQLGKGRTRGGVTRVDHRSRSSIRILGRPNVTARAHVLPTVVARLWHERVARARS
jgi:hypothetical protein